MTKKATDFVNDLKQALGSFTIKVHVSKENSQKLYYLQEDDRDVLAVSKITLEAMTQAFLVSLVSANNLVDDTERAVDKAVEAAAYAYRDDVATRLRTGRRDIPMRPLTKAYIQQKGNSRIGYAGGDLYRDIASAKVTVSSTKTNS